MKEKPKTATQILIEREIAREEWLRQFNRVTQAYTDIITIAMNECEILEESEDGS